jgi:hypothetical protein
MQLNIKINLDGAAIQDGGGGEEIAKLLGKLAETLKATVYTGGYGEPIVAVQSGGTKCDVNGNSILEWEITE